MGRILQHDDSLLLQKSAAASASSNPIHVGGQFTVAISSLSGGLGDSSFIDILINNSNPVIGTPPLAGYDGTYSENAAFANQWVKLGNLASFTASDSSCLINYDKPVRYLSLSSNDGQVIDNHFHEGLSGFVYTDYSAVKTH